MLPLPPRRTVTGAGRQDRIAGGITANTTAKVTSQHGLIYDRMTHALGQEQARVYLEANEKALEKFRELCAQIDCDWEEQTAFVYVGIVS